MPDISQAARHLSQALRFATVSHQDPGSMDPAAFSAFEDFLRDAYPQVHASLEKTMINGHALVFHWPGRDAARRVLLTAHYDVVPADSDGWPHPPFSGQIEDGKVYGRGSFDDKSSLIAMLEAATALLAEGFVPPCGVYFAFGFDEEVGGAQGARQIAAYFESQGLSFDFVLDEGGAVADGAMMGIDRPVAVIGVAEKGNTSFSLSFEGEGGHSSTPPDSTAVSAMAKFISAAAARPEKPRLTETVIAMLKAIAPHRSGLSRFAMSHPRLFAPLIIKTLMKNRQTAAMLRTTVAFTQASGGTAHNVLPASARCTANIRILQGDSSSAVLERFRRLGIPFRRKPSCGMSPPRPPTRIPRHAAPEGLRGRGFPMPSSPLPHDRGTDCRHYDKVARDAYRFLPARVSERELSLMHGRGEYLSLENLERMLAFYTLFLRRLP